MDSGKAFGNLPQFTYAEVPLAERRSKWHTWKRGFEICLRAAKVTQSTDKKDLLLAHGGFELQEIFFNIPGADVEEDKEKGIDPYVVAISKLEDYFAPQRHEAHERFLFWAMRPEDGEPLSKFLMRTQTHASKCDFGKSGLESSSVAVIDKMLQFVPAPLRERLLQETKLTVDEVVKQIGAYEATRSASDHMSGHAGGSSAFRAPEAVQGIQTPCKFCGLEHGSDQQCPAWNRTCSLCGIRGHFRVVCFRRPQSQFSHRPVSVRNQQAIKRKPIQPQGGPAAKSFRGTGRFSYQPRRVHAIDDTGSNNPAEEPVELVEMVSSANDTDELVWAKIGGVLVEMQIDSGVQSNIIDDRTWNMMIQNGVDVIGSERRPDRKFKAYAQKDCLTVNKMFDAEISIADGSKVLKAVARFYVVVGGPQPLLGKFCDFVFRFVLAVELNTLLS